MILLISLATIFPLGIILYQGLQHRTQAFIDSRALSERLAAEVAFDQQLLLSSAKQLMSTFSYIPAIRRRDTVATNALLVDLLRENPQITNFVIADEKGNAWASGLPMKDPSNAADRRYFRNVMATGRFSSGEFNIGRVRNKPTILFGYPLKDGSGRVTDVAVVSLSTDQYERHFQSKGLATDASLALFDYKGTVIFAQPSSASIGQPDREDLFRKMTDGPDKGSFVASGLTGVRRMFTYRKLRLPGESQPYMYVRAGISISSILERTQKDFLLGMGPITAAAILILLSSILLSKRFVLDKVAALREVTERISRGDLSARVPEIVSGGELGELGSSFDNMANRLREADTERQEAVKELRENEERFRSLFESSRDALMTLEPPSWTFTSGNQATVEMFRARSVEDLTNYAPGDLSPERQPDGRLSAEKAKEMIEKAMREGSHFFEWTHKRINGEEFPATVLLTRMEIAGRQFLQATVRDITERKRAEEALQESDARYRGLFEHMLEGIAYCKMIFEKGDPVDFIYLSVNAAFETLTGLKDVVGKKVSEVIPGIRATDPSLFEAYGRVASTGNHEKIENFVEALQQWFSISIYSPEQGHFIALFDVITSRKNAEAEKEKLQAQLQQAMKMEAVGRLAGGVAHDFNNLLTVITGYSELLLQKIGKDSPMHGNVEEIKRAGERAALLTQQLLAFSRKQIIEPKVILLDSMVAELAKMLTRLIGENIALQATTHKPLGSVKVDLGQFQQILMNLVVNARDAMPGGGKIVIETANVDLDAAYCALHPYVTPGRFVMLAVSDTGQGMSEEVKAHIFEPFFTTKERGSGTGLGLATTYGAVHQAGGSIEVYSEIGTGTTFKVYLPRVEEKVVKPVKDDRPADLPGGTETVLIVEDEGKLRDLCVQILEQLGYRVLQARNGTEAIAKVQDYGDRIHLLLTDVVMPGMNGSELATQLVLRNPEMKVLFTSGYTEDVISHHGVLAEGVSFIGKPYTPLALARKVREVLDKP
jgi:PAS domain S-box-containing protein